MRKRWIDRILLGLYAAIVAIIIVTASVVIAIAFMYPLSDEYTENHQLSYICLTSAGTIAFLVSLFVTKNRLINGILMVAIEFYLFGITFQLFTLIT